MNLWQPVDLYCERIGTGLWAEPINVLSNTVYLLAGALPLITVRRTPLAIQSLAVLVLAVGFGSILFHMVANGWSRLADVIPIWTFVIIYLYFCIYNFLRVPFFYSLTLVLIIVLVGAGSVYYLPRYIMMYTNGTAVYLPGLLSAVLVALALSRRNHPAAMLVACGTLSIFIGLVCRALDLAMCQFIPIGTHFVWHIATGIGLYMFVTAAFRYHSVHGKRTEIPMLLALTNAREKHQKR